MATEITLTHSNGLYRKAYVGFSWTSLFFGGIPAAFRGDWMAFFLYFALAIGLVFFTAGFGVPVLWIVWACLYNRWHARRMIERGYQITGGGMSVEQAKAMVAR
jgi:hypothetical protein